MAPDCIFNVMGLADNNFHGLFITNFIFIAFLLLCIVPLHVQLVTICDKLYKLYFYKHFTISFKRIYRVFKIAHGLYRVARQCCQFQLPIPVFQTRLILVLMEPSPLLIPPTPQTPAFQQDRATEEFATLTILEPFMPIEDRSLDNKTPI